jgi:hypothetical protein
MNTDATMFRTYDRLADVALRHVGDSVDPKILALTSGHGEFSRRLLDKHPRVEVTIADLDPPVVGGLAVSDLGNNPRALVCDAVAIEAPAGYFDLAVVAQEFHHLRPVTAAWVLAEGTRVASKLLIIDVAGSPALPRTDWPETVLPSGCSRRESVSQHRIRSSLFTYGAPALLALATYADPAIAVEITTESHTGIIVAHR